jgi:predicted branched-subunit amino acid permease
MSDDSAQVESNAPYWSLDGLGLGARLALPAVPGLVAFGLAVGTTAARKGLGVVDALLMNGLVFAGASQMVAMEIWPERFTLLSIAALAIVTATVNARLLLMGASLRPWLGSLPPWQTYPMLHMLTDPGWLVAMRYRAGGGGDASVLLGGSLLFFAAWNVAAASGYLLGAQIANPRAIGLDLVMPIFFAIGLDLVMPIFFAIMLIPLWQGTRRGIAWVIAGAVALLVEYLVAGWWFILAGALAGALAEGLTSDD